MCYVYICIYIKSTYEGHAVGKVLLEIIFFWIWSNKNHYVANLSQASLGNLHHQPESLTPLAIVYSKTL